MFLSEETPLEIPSENIFFAPGATNVLETLAKICQTKEIRLQLKLRIILILKEISNAQAIPWNPYTTKTPFHYILKQNAPSKMAPNASS
jgi:hypothetical protein